MAEKTQKELLISLIEMQGKQNNDITEIKTCLLGDEYHSGGLIDQVSKNTECITSIKQKRIPDIEKSIERRSGVLGGIIAFITVVATTVANWFIFGNK